MSPLSCLLTPGTKMPIFPAEPVCLPQSDTSQPCVVFTALGTDADFLDLLVCWFCVQSKAEFPFWDHTLLSFLLCLEAQGSSCPGSSPTPAL